MTTQGQQRVLDTALAMFADRGYAATSMRDLAGQLGLKAASLYSHYPDGKDDLLHHAVAPFLDALDAMLDRTDADPYADLDLCTWVQNYAELLAAHRAAVRVTGADLAVTGHPAIGRVLAAINGRTRSLLREHSGMTELQAAASLVVCL